MRNDMLKGFTVSAALLITATGCSEEAATPEDTAPAEQGGEAAGDVQDGTISDAMIPLEALRSQSPTLERQTSSATTGATASAEAEELVPARPETPATPDE
ncbi:MAG: hypothetical protein AAF291_00130 [Pseudomonadota bacterium]